MKRILAYLMLMCFATGCACTHSKVEPIEAQRVTQNDRDDANGEPQPETRFARPPAGSDAAPTWQEAPPERTLARDDSHGANEPAKDYAPDTRRSTATPPAAMADKARSGADYDAGGSAGAVEGNRPAPAPQNGAAQPMAKKAERSYEDERPGLGTSWGETRSSHVWESAFERDSYAPTYTASMSYNDRRGASALANGGYSGNASLGLSSALTVSLRDGYGNTLPAYRGGGRTVAVGENGQRYTIVVQNHTNERFEVVMSVDGLDVLDGEDASYNKRGYLIDPYATVEIEGFRQSADAVAAFRFGSVSDSYAARTGSARNVGVIGFAAFGERGYAYRLQAYQERLAQQRYSSRETDRRRNADPFPAKWADPPPSPISIAR